MTKIKGFLMLNIVKTAIQRQVQMWLGQILNASCYLIKTIHEKLIEDLKGLNQRN